MHSGGEEYPDHFPSVRWMSLLCLVSVWKNPYIGKDAAEAEASFRPLRALPSQAPSAPKVEEAKISMAVGAFVFNVRRRWPVVLYLAWEYPAVAEESRTCRPRPACRRAWMYLLPILRAPCLLVLTPELKNTT